METIENIIRVELIDDPAAIAERRGAAGVTGDEQECKRCGDDSGPIAAILVVPAGGETCWELCAECLRAMPHRGMLS